MLVVYCNACIEGNPESCQRGEIIPNSKLGGWLCHTNFKGKDDKTYYRTDDQYLSFTNDSYLLDPEMIDEATQIVSSLSETLLEGVQC